MKSRTKEQALAALDGMAHIVKSERLVRGEYVSQDIDPARTGAVCRGHKYCAIGSLWAGAGIHPVVRYGSFDLPGSDQDERPDFLRPRHGLRAAYDALNAAAGAYITKHKADVDHDFSAPVEALFEGDKEVGRTELLQIIGAAKRRVKAAA